ncbi:MAG: GNAT family N-acetyltransferase [Bacilli bacterium]|nr:GNAT family N-acetyltransferase [Bacilli bacterium]
MNYELLSNCSFVDFLDCINDAFSDYLLNIHFNEKTLTKFLNDSNVDPNLSICAYDDNKIIGFILNSKNIYNDELVIFDAGTGVRKAYRGKGVFSSLFVQVVTKLKENNIHKYYLEVLQNNERAIKLYTKNGFTIVRNFSVVFYQNAKIVVNNEFKKMKFNEFKNNNFMNMKHIAPSFENSNKVIEKRNPMVGLDIENKAYVIFDEESGDILQIGYESLSSLKDLLSKIISNYPHVVIKNIDESYSEVIKILLSLGFVTVARQFEMVKDIK